MGARATDKPKRTLHRQRVILALLQEAGGDASHMEATKWAFLVREETPSRGGSAFYQFLPYRFGPFSFCLYQEASAMARNGLLTEEDPKRWAVTPAGRLLARDVPPAVRDDVRKVVRRHSHRRSSDLIDYVYERHPWYTVNSEIRRLGARPRADVKIYTAGYEGMLVDGFLDSLMRSGLQRLIDVRSNPVSRRYGFHKSTLGRLCQNVGIEYAHFPSLGIASSKRHNLERPGARAALFDEYARTTLETEQGALADVAALVQEQPSVLVCMESCHTECHRSRLAEALSRRTGLPTCHLGP